MRALVAGSAGQLGRELRGQLGADCVWAGDRGEIDVTDEVVVAALVARIQPDVVWNATAWNQVDGAESEPGAAFAVNALAPRNLARAAREAGALLVHFSTDYVFDGRGRQPYREDARTGPLSVYGVSKLAGEQLVAASGGEHLIVRTSGLIGRGGSEQKGGSFVDRILTRARSGAPLRVVDDQVFAPTVAMDLARAAIALVKAGARGIFHLTNEGACSWRELAAACLAIAGLEVPVEPIALAELRLPAARPLYSVLDNHRYRELALPALRPWREALIDCVR